MNEKELHSALCRSEALRKLRLSLDDWLGRPIWWLASRNGLEPTALKKCVEACYELWHDPRTRKFRWAPAICRFLKCRPRETAVSFLQSFDGALHYLVPISSADGKVLGTLGLSGLRKGVSKNTLRVLTEYFYCIVDNCHKTEEIERLSATIRPRAIALSTVHTVHRIINSTLNLDELISRLAHLTAQVLRVKRSAIFLLENNRKKHTRLVCKARVGFPKHSSPPPPVSIGRGLEGSVVKTARIVLRKKVLCVPLIDEDVIGVITVHHKKEAKEFSCSDQEILTTLAEEAVIAIKNAQLYEEQKKVTLGTIQSLAAILGTKLPHRVAPEAFLHFALSMAAELRLSEEDTQALHYATLLKDTAKIGIPDKILNKPTKLTGEEYRLIREHPIHGAKIVQSFENLKPVVPIILYSREKYDGSGYPKGLKGEKIPIGARILAVINAFEAIITGRPYRSRASLDEALNEIRRNSGAQFDPQTVEAFLKVVRKEGIPKLFNKSS